MKAYWIGLLTGVFIGASAFAYCVTRDECLAKHEGCEKAEDKTCVAAYISGQTGF